MLLLLLKLCNYEYGIIFNSLNITIFANTKEFFDNG